MSYSFRFNSYTLNDNNKLSFTYSYVDTTGNVLANFKESLTLPSTIKVSVNDPVTAQILKHLHVIVGISYYKSLRGNVELPYEVSPSEADYYNDVYDLGLGEYKYINKLTGPITPFTPTTQDENSPVQLETNGALLGIGGGKDSIVAGELLKKLGIETTTLDMSTKTNHGQADVVMNIMGLSQLNVGRYLDTSISGFTQEHNGFNGHVPLSTIIAWVGVLLAYVSKIRYVAMANEGSTSTGNTVWNGREVNHQWAKSLEAEQLTQRFIEANVSPNIHYLSPIRPYGSLVIMELLARLGEPYLYDFTSCNLVLRIDPATRPNGRWCTKCAKCLSSWLLLSSWIDTDKLVGIFGRNLWNDMSLRDTLESLLGLQNHKPLDCVGTIDELRAATRNVLDNEVGYPLLADITSDMISGPSIEELTNERFEHNMPEQFAADIDRVVTSLL